jgi:hypothetical protein
MMKSGVQVFSVAMRVAIHSTILDASNPAGQGVAEMTVDLYRNYAEPPTGDVFVSLAELPGRFQGRGERGQLFDDHRHSVSHGHPRSGGVGRTELRLDNK